MRRFFDTTGFTLVETLVVVAIFTIVIGGAAAYFVNFEKASSTSDRQATARSDTLQAAALVQALLSRRNVTLDRAPSSNPSLEYKFGSQPELTIRARPTPAATENSTYTLFNRCEKRPTSAPGTPLGSFGRCNFTCPASQAPSVAIKIEEGGQTRTRPLVATSDKAQVGRVAGSAFCFLKEPSLPGVQVGTLEIVTRLYAADGKSYGPDTVAIEGLLLNVRDHRVEFTGRD
jgi:prepilin-type N-terminal cleavage/methylation domain-containing protein